MQEVKVNTVLGELTIILVEDKKIGGYTSFFKDTRTDLCSVGDTAEEAVNNLEQLLIVVLEYEDRRHKINVFFTSILNEEVDIVDRNTLVFIGINTLINQKNFLMVDEILNEFLTISVHPSLIQSALIITGGVDEENIKKTRIIVEDHLKKILNL